MTEKVIRIERNDILGNYMVANRNIKQGELILKEKPIMVGPQISGLLHCFNCFQTLNPDRYKVCSKCGVALVCNQICKGNYHTDQECSHLRTVKIDTKKLAENHQIIFALRCIMLKNYSPETYEKILSLEPHLEARRDTTIWRRHKIAVEDILKEIGVFGENELEGELVQRICGIIDVNSFEIRPRNIDDYPQSNPLNPELECLRGLYPESAMMAHDCHGNVHLSVDDDFVLTIHASVDIKKDEMILFNYAGVLQGYVDREKHLKEGKYFTCTCKRCQDPSEFGTELSSLRCHKCLKGLIRPDIGAKTWSCDACMGSFTGQVVQLAVEEAKRRVEETDPTDIEALECLYKKLSLTFHPNHYVLLNLKQNMVLLYSGLPPSINNLNRKIDLCARLLSVYSRLEPGISRIRALTLYELQSAMVDLSHKQYRQKAINEETLINELSTAEHILKDALKNLLYEPSHSPEGRIAQMAMKELKMLRYSIKTIQEDLISNASDINVSSQEARRNDVNKRLKDKLESNKNKTKEGGAEEKKHKKLQPNTNKNKEDVGVFIENTESRKKQNETIHEAKSTKKEAGVDNKMKDNSNTNSIKERSEINNNQDSTNKKQKKLQNGHTKNIDVGENNKSAKNHENPKDLQIMADKKKKEKNIKKAKQERTVMVNNENTANKKQKELENTNNLQDGDSEYLANNHSAEIDKNPKELQTIINIKKKNRSNKNTNQKTNAIISNEDTANKTQNKVKGGESENLVINKTTGFDENLKEFQFKEKSKAVKPCDKNDLINNESKDLININTTGNNKGNTNIDIKENHVVVDKSSNEVDNVKTFDSVKSKSKRSRNKNKK